MIKRSYDYIIRLMVLGDLNVGKTSLIDRYTKDFYRPKQSPTIGLDYRNTDYSIRNKVVRVQVWDTAGQEMYRALTAIAVRDIDGILLVYDSTNRKTFENLQEIWFNFVKQYRKDSSCIVLVANKNDLESNIALTSEEGQILSAKFGATYFEASAKIATNVFEAFECLVKEIFHKIQEVERSNQNLDINLERDETYLSCCSTKSTKCIIF